MWTRILLMATMVPLTASTAAAQRVEALIRTSVAESKPAAGRMVAPARALRFRTRSGSAPSLLDLLATVLEHVRMKGERERLAVDLRLRRQSVRVGAGVPGVSGEWRLRVTLGAGLARLSSHDPLEEEPPAPQTRSSLFLEGGMTIEFAPTAGWRLFAGISDRVRVWPAASSDLETYVQRVVLTPLEVGCWSPPLTLGLDIGW